MCITFLPANVPTGSGIWWRDDDKWRTYSKENEEKIRHGLKMGLKKVDLGLIRSDVHPKGNGYVVNLLDMEQVSSYARQRRPILVTDLKPPPFFYQEDKFGSKDGLQLHLFYTDHNGFLRQYEEKTARASIEAYVSYAASKGPRTFEIARDKNSFYSFDFKTMTQSVIRKYENQSILVAEPVSIIIEIPRPPAVKPAPMVSGGMEAKTKRNGFFNKLVDSITRAVAAL